MKICITSLGDNLDSKVDPRFGRAMYFIIIDTETDDFEVIKNPAVDAGGGAGTQSSQLMMDKGVKVVITGNIGPNAMQILKSADIKILTKADGTVKEVYHAYKEGKLK